MPDGLRPRHPHGAHPDTPWPSDTIVSWNEPDTGVDYALSFQDPEGCTELWEQICTLQGRSPGEAPRDDDQPASSGQAAQGYAQLQLPAAELRNLAAIAELLTDAPPVRRAKLVEGVQQDGYVAALVGLFGVVEDLDNRDDLHHVFNIFKGLVLLNDVAVYELLLRSDLVMGVMGALEYDPEISSNHCVRHRAFLRDQLRFKQVVPIADEEVLKRIHQNYHLNFLKDVVLPRSLDDNTFAALNQISYCNNVHIINALSADAKYLPQLRRKLAEEREPDALLDATRLLHELCNTAKHMQLYHRTAFYRKFVENAFFGPLAACLVHELPALRLSSIEVLLASVHHEPALLRQFVLQQRPECEMMHALIRMISAPSCSGEKPQAKEVLCALLDPEGMEGREQDEFLNLFYEEFVHKLAQPVAGKVAPGIAPMNGAVAEMGEPAAEGDGSEVLSARQHVCEMLCFCVSKHTYRIKYFILRNNILNKCLRIARSRDKWLVLAVIRFFRTCVGLKDDFYNRYIVKNNCFATILRHLDENRHRDNLLHSAILELLEFVRRENVKVLVAHLAENYRDLLAQMVHCDVFKGLLLRHEQNEEYKNAGAARGPGAAGAPHAQPAGARRAFPDEEEDDAYFNDSDEEEEQRPPVEVDDRPFMARQPTGGIAFEEEKENQQLSLRLRTAAVDVGPQPAAAPVSPPSIPPSVPPSQFTAAAAPAPALPLSVADHGGSPESPEESMRKRQRVDDSIPNAD